MDSLAVIVERIEDKNFREVLSNNFEYWSLQNL